MAYTKTVWSDRQVTNPLRFSVTLISGTAGATGAVYDFIPSEGTITNAGTPLNATNLNNLENGVFNLDAQVTTNTSDISALQGNRVLKSGDTMTGTLNAPTVNATGNLQEGGTNLSAKYFQISGGTITGAVNISAGAVVTILKATGNNGTLSLVAGASNNALQSADSANTTARDLNIEGFSGATINNVNVKTNNFKINGQPMIQSGSVSITANSGNPAFVHVNFPVAFTSAPIVMVTPVSAVPGTQILGVSANNITNTGCDIYMTRTGTTVTTVQWLASSV